MARSRVARTAARRVARTAASQLGEESRRATLDLILLVSLVVPIFVPILGAGCQGARIRPFGDDGSAGRTNLVTPDGGGADQATDGEVDVDVGEDGQGRDAKRDDRAPDSESDGKPDSAGSDVAVKVDASLDGIFDAVSDAPSDATLDGASDVARNEAGGGTGGHAGDDGDAAGHDGSGPCTRDEQCSPDLKMGTPMMCFDGACRTGECHTSADCQSGQLCGVAQARFCGSCPTDQACVADARFGAGFLCVAGACVRGDCHNKSQDCTGAAAGEICGGQAPATCGACVLDAQCQTDPAYGADTICSVMAGGRCASATCAGEGTTCAQNGDDVCCGGRCLGGNCCADADCTRNALFGAGWTCKAHTCSKCDGATGNRYVVDPVAGNDDTATGSGTSGAAPSPACAFRTVTRALALIGSVPPVGTTITVLGQAGTTTPFFLSPSVAASGASSGSASASASGAGESLPIVVPANVTLTTSGGPLSLTLGSKVAGFKLVGAGAALTAIAAAPIKIDGSDNTSDSGVIVSLPSGDSAKLAHVVIDNTGNDAINVTAGVALIGPGVHGRHSGTTGTRRSGLHVIGGGARIEVAKDQAPTSFDENTLNGIRVVNTSLVSVTGVPSSTPDGTGTVVVRGNQGAGFFFAQTPGMVAASSVSVIDGLVAWGTQSGPGLRLFGGTNVKLRRSVILANGTDGVLVSPMDSTAEGQSVARMDLGTASDPGRNVLQQAVGAAPNLDAGLCLTLPQAKLSARGNIFAGADCATATDATLTRSSGCDAHVDLGLSEASSSVDVASCK